MGEENVSKGTGGKRLFEVDCVKFFAIIFMVCIHIYEQFGNWDFDNLSLLDFFR